MLRALKRPKVLVVLAVTVMVFGFILWLSGWLLGRAFPGLENPSLAVALWTLRGLIIAIGLAVLFAVLRFLSSSADDASESEAPGSKIDEAFDQVRVRLAQSNIEGRSVGREPVVLLLGPTGSTKTTVIEKAGARADLLAGEVQRDGQVVPTDLLNIWLGDHALFVEAGGGLLDGGGAWQRLVRHLRPKRLAAALGRGQQAARVVLVCFPCDALQTEDSRGLAASAHRIRERLTELTDALGNPVPVYVLFTRADALPHFQEYVQPLTKEEAGQVLGATLRLGSGSGGGPWAEREAHRIGMAFDRLFYSLASRRTAILRNEPQERQRGGGYEFPREFRKIRSKVAHFLIELGRPSRLAVSPVLRGFYFTGLRPLLVEERTAPASPAVRASSGEDPVGATMIFNPSGSGPGPGPVPGSSSTRRVPDWVFLGRLIPEVILGDRVAMAITRGGLRVNFVRRLLLGTAAGLATVFAIGFTTSFFHNRALQRDLVSGLEALRGAQLASEALPDALGLGTLDQVGRQLVRLRRHETDRPLRYRWFLYQGSRLLPPVRSAYFGRFDVPLARPTRRVLEADLATLPPVPDSTSDYDSTYETLRTYLILTGDFARSDRQIVDVLQEARLRESLADTAQATLVAAQYAFYADELPYGDPYSWERLESPVTLARAHLAQFREVDQLYRQLVASVGAEVGPLTFEREAGAGAASAIPVSYVVPGAYTREGWTLVQSENLEGLTEAEDWVLDRRLDVAQVDALREELRARYRTDYNSTWLEFLASASISGLGSFAAAASTLEELAGPSSPILRLVSVISLHTDVGDEVATVFAPAHLIVPPPSDSSNGGREQLISESNEPYVDALAGGRFAAQAAADDLSDANELTDPVRDEVREAARGIDAAVADVAQGFPSSDDARRVGDELTDLLARPARRLLALLNVPVPPGVPPGVELEQELIAFCSDFQEPLSRYPFGPGEGQTTPGELDAMFSPEGGLLWTFLEEDREWATLEGPEGTRRLVPVEGASPRPGGSFFNFVNWALDVAQAFYRGGEGPSVPFGFRAITYSDLPVVNVVFAGNAGEFAEFSTASIPMEWDLNQATQAIITGEIDGQEIDLWFGDGAWGLFRVFRLAELPWQQLSSTEYLVSWDHPEEDVRLQAEVAFLGGMPILNPDVLNAPVCSPSVQ